MIVDVEIICIGNELLIGKIQNTNAYWLAKQATEIGVRVKRITVIEDTLEAIANSLNEAIARKPKFIITTGGLGPTFDDMTLQGVAKALDRKLEINAIALEMVKRRCIEYAKKRGEPVDIELTPPRLKMAVFPEKTEVVTNPIGTAPGLHVNLNGSELFVLPGVPAEMEAIFKQTIEPLIRKEVGQAVFCQRSVSVENMWESRLAPLIDQVMANNKGVYIKSHPMHTYIELHLTVSSDQEQKPANVLLKAAKEIKDLIDQNGGRATI